MSEFTYEEAVLGRLETYEWDNVWWERNRDLEHPRVMYLGDSISCGIRSVWNKIEGIEWYVDNCGTSKALDNPFLLNLAISFCHQQRRCDGILINNGAHGSHLSNDEYESYYEKLIMGLQKEFHKIPIILVTTTFSPDDSRNAVVILRNEAVMRISKKFSLPVIDLYETSKNLTYVDKVHLDNEGYGVLAEKIRADLKVILK